MRLSPKAGSASADRNHSLKGGARRPIPPQSRPAGRTSGPSFQPTLAKLRLRNWLYKGMTKLFPGYGGDGIGAEGMFGLWPFLPGSSYDYQTEAGALWENAIVMAGINWMATTLPEAVLGVGDIGKATLDPNHPAARLIANPNPSYDGTHLWAGAVLSLVVDGNAYWRKVRSASGRVAELWYVPHYRVEPIWPQDGSAFLSGYKMRIDGQDVILAPEEMIHLRHHVLDPMNERKGISPLKAALRDICTDNESASYTASLLRNAGVPGALICPEGASGPERELVFERRQREELASLWRSKFTGDRRGEPFVAPVPMKVMPFSFNPQQMLIDKVTERPEERICALLNIPPVVLNLGTGLRNATAKASFEDSRRAAYEGNIVPTQNRLARQLTQQLLPDFDGEGLEFKWDRSAIEILKESEDARFLRAGQAFQNGLMTRNEARLVIGLPPTKSDQGDTFCPSQGAAKATESRAEDDSLS